MLQKLEIGERLFKNDYYKKMKTFKILLGSITL